MCMWQIHLDFIWTAGGCLAADYVALKSYLGTRKLPSLSMVGSSSKSYLGTRESPPLKVVGSSSKMEEMSLPSGTDTRVYMTFSWGFLRRARRSTCSESSWRRNMETQSCQITVQQHRHVHWIPESMIMKSKIIDRLSAYTEYTKQ
jgi:hypothetical protein